MHLLQCRKSIRLMLSTTYKSVGSIKYNLILIPLLILKTRIKKRIHQISKLLSILNFKILIGFDITL